MINYAYHLNFMPIKRTIPKPFGYRLITAWEKRGYKVYVKEGRDYYFIYDERGMR